MLVYDSGMLFDHMLIKIFVIYYYYYYYDYDYDYDFISIIIIIISVWSECKFDKAKTIAVFAESCI